MGLVLDKLRVNILLTDYTNGEEYFNQKFKNNGRFSSETTLPDLSSWPPELSLYVLSFLNATDLCLASCVWEHLATDDLLWQSLCHITWGYLSIYTLSPNQELCYRKLYLQLDEATLIYNTNAMEGIKYLLQHNLLRDDPLDIAKFLFNSRRLNPIQTRSLLEIRSDILEHLVELHNFRDQFLANALRQLFRRIYLPPEGATCMQKLLEKFSLRFCQCNPHLQLTPDNVYVLCFSLLILSVDLCSPHVKNKMSKREFIRNVRHAVQPADDELAGHLYDNIYLQGHVAKCAT